MKGSCKAGESRYVLDESVTDRPTADGPTVRSTNRRTDVACSRVVAVDVNVTCVAKKKNHELMNNGIIHEKKE